MQEGAAIKSKKAYIELKNTSQGVYFTTKTLKGLTDEYRDVTKDYERKQSSLVKEVVGIAGKITAWLETPGAQLTSRSLPQLPTAPSSKR